MSKNKQTLPYEKVFLDNPFDSISDHDRKTHEKRHLAGKPRSNEENNMEHPPMNKRTGLVENNTDNEDEEVSIMTMTMPDCTWDSMQSNDLESSGVGAKECGDQIGGDSSDLPDREMARDGGISKPGDRLSGIRKHVVTTKCALGRGESMKNTHESRMEKDGRRESLGKKNEDDVKIVNQNNTKNMMRKDHNSGEDDDLHRDSMFVNRMSSNNKVKHDIVDNDKKSNTQNGGGFSTDRREDFDENDRSMEWEDWSIIEDSSDNTQDNCKDNNLPVVYNEKEHEIIPFDDGIKHSKMEGHRKVTFEDVSVSVNGSRTSETEKIIKYEGEHRHLIPEISERIPGIQGTTDSVSFGNLEGVDEDYLQNRVLRNKDDFNDEICNLPDITEVFENNSYEDKCVVSDNHEDISSNFMLEFEDKIDENSSGIGIVDRNEPFNKNTDKTVVHGRCCGGQKEDLIKDISSDDLNPFLLVYKEGAKFLTSTHPEDYSLRVVCPNSSFVFNNDDFCIVSTCPKVSTRLARNPVKGGLPIPVHIYETDIVKCMGKGVNNIFYKEDSDVDPDKHLSDYFRWIDFHVQRDGDSIGFWRYILLEDLDKEDPNCLVDNIFVILNRFISNDNEKSNEGREEDCFVRERSFFWMFLKFFFHDRITWKYNNLEPSKEKDKEQSSQTENICLVFIQEVVRSLNVQERSFHMLIKLNELLLKNESDGNEVVRFCFEHAHSLAIIFGMNSVSGFFNEQLIDFIPKTISRCVDPSIFSYISRYHESDVSDVSHAKSVLDSYYLLIYKAFLIIGEFDSAIYLLCPKSDNRPAKRANIEDMYLNSVPDTIRKSFIRRNWFSIVCHSLNSRAPSIHPNYYVILGDIFHLNGLCYVSQFCHLVSRFTSMSNLDAFNLHAFTIVISKNINVIDSLGRWRLEWLVSYITMRLLRCICNFVHRNETGSSDVVEIFKRVSEDIKLQSIDDSIRFSYWFWEFSSNCDYLTYFLSCCKKTSPWIKRLRRMFSHRVSGIIEDPTESFYEIYYENGDNFNKTIYSDAHAGTYTDAFHAETYPIYQPSDEPQNSYSPLTGSFASAPSTLYDVDNIEREPQKTQDIHHISESLETDNSSDPENNDSIYYDVHNNTGEKQAKNCTEEDMGSPEETISSLTGDVEKDKKDPKYLPTSLLSGITSKLSGLSLLKRGNRNSDGNIVYVAHLGSDNHMVYDEELERYIDKNTTPEERDKLLKDKQASSRPPTLEELMQQNKNPEGSVYSMNPGQEKIQRRPKYIDPFSQKL